MESPSPSNQENVPSAPERLLVDELVGKRVIKDFYDEALGALAPFGGTIKSYSSRDKWFHVVYDDGDAEDVYLEEALAITRAADTAEAAGRSVSREARNLGTNRAEEKGSETTKGAARAKLALPPKRVKEKTLYTWRRGQEPWRKLLAFQIPVAEDPVLDSASRKAFRDCKLEYYKRYRQAEIEEEERLEREGLYDEQGKRRCKRPDRVTESALKKGGVAINAGKHCGFVPGLEVSQRFYARAEMGCLGLHPPPVAGIDFAGREVAGKGVPSFALSIVVGGWYEDNNDGGAELICTGGGGNDLLGSRKQFENQKLVKGNAALVGNIQLGLPVRVTRKNKDPHGLYGCVFLLDGRYDVREYWQEKGKEGFEVFKYRLVRRPGQGALLSQQVRFGGVSAPKKLSWKNRNGVVDVDVSGGREALPVLAVNETEDGELPPCTPLERVPAEDKLMCAHRGISAVQLEALRRRKWTPSVEYVTEYHLTIGIKAPPPPTLPARFKADPHAYIEQLNHGRLPYLEAKGGKLLQLREALPVVYACGPWTGCTLGADCPQAATQRQLSFRLEVFSTGDGRGWGVRSLDMIPQHAFTCGYIGEVFRAKEYDRMGSTGYNGVFAMDMAIRPDRDWEGNCKEDTQSAETADFVICGLRKRNVAAWMNHSCAPNCFVQPVLSHHHDNTMPRIAIFAAEDIAPLTQLTFDYGEDYASVKFDDGCKCGAVECIAKRPSGGKCSPAVKGKRRR